MCISASDQQLLRYLRAATSAPVIRQFILENLSALRLPDTIRMLIGQCVTPILLTEPFYRNACIRYQRLFGYFCY